MVKRHADALPIRLAKCTALSQLKFLKTWDEGTVHLKFVMKTSKVQLPGIPVFLDELPWPAWSWHLDFVKKVLDTNDISARYCAQCFTWLRQERVELPWVGSRPVE